MLNAIFDKTDKGREEIATRKFQLAARMRSLLVLVDGKRSGEDLLDKMSGLGLDGENLAELLKDGYICVTGVALDAEAPPDAGAALARPSLGIAETVRSPERQLQTIRDFYADTIKSHIGLRGYPLQLKVERARSLEDLYALRASYLEALFVAKGEELARSLRDQLDQLFHNG
jgi:hypothetical protein